MQMVTGNEVFCGGHVSRLTHSTVSYSRVMRQPPAERVCPSLTLANGP